MPKEIDKIKEKFISDIIEQRKNLEILIDEDYKIINMDETACFLDMNSDTTIEFTGKKNVEIITSGRDFAHRNKRWILAWNVRSGGNPLCAAPYSQVG